MRREKSGQVRVCSPEETDSEEEHIDIHVINSFILMKRPRRAPKKAPKPVLCALSLQPIPKDVCVFRPVLCGSSLHEEREVRPGDRNFRKEARRGQLEAQGAFYGSRVAVLVVRKMYP